MVNLVLFSTNQIADIFYVCEKWKYVLFSDKFNARSLLIVSIVVKLSILDLCGGLDAASWLVLIVIRLLISALFSIETCESIVKGISNIKSVWY